MERSSLRIVRFKLVMLDVVMKEGGDGASVLPSAELKAFVQTIKAVPLGNR
jgi:hypothetical protein